MDGIKNIENRLELKVLDLKTILDRKPRAILGWCEHSRTAFTDLNYDPCPITYSRCDNSGSRITERIDIQDPQIGVSQIGSVAAKIKIAPRPVSVPFPHQNNLEQILERASLLPVLLFDHEHRRSWLVMTSDAILLIARRRYLPPRGILPPSAFGDITAVETLAELAARGVLLSDWIVSTWSFLEMLTAKLEESLSGKHDWKRGIFSGWGGDNLCGYEFMAATEQKSACPKRVELKSSHGGWNRLVRQAKALVLFGAGFGELIYPSPHSRHLMCQRWAKMPREHDYMATCVSTMLELYREAGEELTLQRFTTGRPELRWDCTGSQLFEPCEGHKCTCDRRQRIVSTPWIGSRAPRSPRRDELHQDGAVIFGKDRGRMLGGVSLSRGHTANNPSVRPNPQMQQNHAAGTGPLDTPDVGTPGSSHSSELDDDTTGSFAHVDDELMPGSLLYYNPWSH